VFVVTVTIEEASFPALFLFINQNLPLKQVVSDPLRMTKFSFSEFKSRLTVL